MAEACFQSSTMQSEQPLTFEGAWLIQAKHPCLRVLDRYNNFSSYNLLDRRQSFFYDLGWQWDITIFNNRLLTGF